MSIINRAVLNEHLWPGIMYFFGLEYADYPEEYGDIFNERSSSKAYEEYVMESAFGLAPVKEQGAPIFFDSAGETWKGRVEHTVYGLGFAITREAVEDDQYFDLVPRYSRALKRSMRITKEVRAASFVDGVFSGSTVGDGQPVCSASHPIKGGGTLSNLGAASADLNETSLEAAIIQIANWTDERGLRIAARPTKLHVPNGLQFTAERLLTAEMRPGTDSNDPNVLRKKGMIPGGYSLNHYLSDPKAWFLTTDVSEGMTYWNRRGLEINEADGTEVQIFKVMATERYAFSCMDWRGFFGMPGA